MVRPQENPTQSAPSETVRLAVINCYCELQHVEVDVADGGFNGGIPFDSILGVEMAANLELALSIVISEKRLAKTSVYSSLAAFAAMVQQCMEETPK